MWFNVEPCRARMRPAAVSSCVCDNGSSDSWMWSKASCTSCASASSIQPLALDTRPCSTTSSDGFLVGLLHALPYSLGVTLGVLASSCCSVGRHLPSCLVEPSLQAPCGFFGCCGTHRQLQEALYAALQKIVVQLHGCPSLDV